MTWITAHLSTWRTVAIASKAMSAEVLLVLTSKCCLPDVRKGAETPDSEGFESAAVAAA
jgi:hypothetical protein